MELQEKFNKEVLTSIEGLTDMSSISKKCLDMICELVKIQSDKIDLLEAQVNNLKQQTK
mgnify:FL=1|tara:strand:+ start:259 stop:435 length:177 start_codon:yes stop_codon:yes gene_type:complete